MENHHDLWKEIERLQEILHDTVSKKGSASPEAIRAIQAFRNKLQEYNDLVKR
jgi:hypothetical protein